jgi:hypothetical protein
VANFGDITNQEDINRYGLDMDSILFLTEELIENQLPKTQKENAITPLQKVKMALRYFASGKIQLRDANIPNISKSSASIYISQVIEALTKPHIVLKFISSPKTQRDFYDTASFPNVLGVIGGIHVQLQAPTQNEEVYANGMKYHSMNIQVQLFSLNHAFCGLNNCQINMQGLESDNLCEHFSAIMIE